MWNTFWPDLLVAVLGAIVGSVLTVAIAFGTYLLQRRVRESQALRTLVEELHHRRAVAPISDVRDVPVAGGTDDFKHVNLSILDIRDRVRLTREQVRPESSAQRSLSRMTRACNRYLEVSAQRPEKYLHELMVLRAELWGSVQEVAGLSRSIDALKPGEAAY